MKSRVGHRLVAQLLLLCSVSLKTTTSMDPSATPPAVPKCVLDPSMVNPDTLALLDDVGVSIFASACSKNRGAFVLDPPHGHTYGCLALPPMIQHNASLFPLTKVEDITENYANGNLTAEEATEMLNFLVERVYASTPGVEVSPYACDINGLVTLENCPGSNQRRLKEKSDSNNPKIEPEPKKENATTTTPIRAATVAGIFAPAAWAVKNSSTPSTVTLTQRDAEFFYTAYDFSNMSAMGLNTVQFPVAVELFGNMPKAHPGWLGLLKRLIGFTNKYKMQAIVKLEYVPSRVDDPSLLGAIQNATIFCDDLNQHFNKTVIKALTLPSHKPAVLEAARNATVPLWIPAQPQDLTHIGEILAAVPDVPIQAISLDLSHTSTVAEIASSTSGEDRAKMFFHETMACLKRAPLQYTKCYQQLPVFVSGGFDLAIDDCHMERILGKTYYKDYGQCGRLAETVYSNWWHDHRKSFAARQIAAYEKGGLGWSFATWKVFRVGSQKVGRMDKPAKLLALQDVHANGWMPSLVKDQEELALACLNPPENDFVLGDETLAPTMGPPPDCGDGWWNETTEQCDFWIPPPFNATECPNTTIIYEACNLTEDGMIDAEDLVEDSTTTSKTTGHHAQRLQGFLGGLVVACGFFAGFYLLCVKNSSKKDWHEYDAVPNALVRGDNGFQEYQHHSAETGAVAGEDEIRPLRNQGRTIFS